MGSCSQQTAESARVDREARLESWHRSPLWLRLLGSRGVYREDRGCYRLPWGELSLRPCSIGVTLGGYETAHLHLAWGLGQVFIRLPFLDRAICGGENGIESPRYGFALHPTDFHLNWSRRTKIVNFPWQRRYLFREVLGADGIWRERRMSHRLGSSDLGEAAALAPHKIEAPYHYMLGSGEVQHVTATMSRERSWTVWYWFGESGYRRKAAVSDWLRNIQKRLGRPKHYIEIEFSGEVGERAGSWKGGCIGCSYEMMPGETPSQTLRRMQRERRFS